MNTKKVSKCEQALVYVWQTINKITGSILQLNYQGNKEKGVKESFYVYLSRLDQLQITMSIVTC